MPGWPILFDYLSEAIKIIGGLASFYAVFKLRHSLATAKQLIGLIEMVQRTGVNTRGVQFDEIYGIGIGLVRSLRHDQVDQDWSRK